MSEETDPAAGRGRIPPIRSTAVLVSARLFRMAARKFEENSRDKGQTRARPLAPEQVLE